MHDASHEVFPLPPGFIAPPASTTESALAMRRRELLAAYAVAWVAERRRRRLWTYAFWFLVAYHLMAWSLR